MENRKRNRRIEIKVTDEEYEFIQEKMLAIGSTNLSAYARKMLIDGYVLKTDFSFLKDFIFEIGKIGTNINQIAYRANAFNNIDKTDIEEIKQGQKEIRKILNRDLRKFYKTK